MINIELVGFEEAKRAMLGAGKNFPAALRDAIKRGLDHGRTVAPRLVSARYNLSIAEAKGAIQVKMAGDGGALEVKAPMLPITVFKPTLGKKGVRVAVIRGQRKLISRSFVSGGRILRREGSERYPIRGVAAIGVASMVAVPEVAPEVEKAIGEFAAQRLAANVDRALSGSAFK